MNTANALFSLVALYVIQKPRNGAAAAIQQLMDLDYGLLVQLIIIAVVVAGPSYIAIIGIAQEFARTISKLNYQMLCVGVLAFLLAMTYAFTGVFGLFIFFLSTVWG